MEFYEVAFVPAGEASERSPLLRNALHDDTDPAANREYKEIFLDSVASVARETGAVAVKSLQLSLDRAGRRVLEPAALYHLLARKAIMCWRRSSSPAARTGLLSFTSWCKCRCARCRRCRCSQHNTFSIMHCCCQQVHSNYEANWT